MYLSLRHRGISYLRLFVNFSLYIKRRSVLDKSKTERPGHNQTRYHSAIVGRSPGIGNFYSSAPCKIAREALSPRPSAPASITGSTFPNCTFFPKLLPSYFFSLFPSSGIMGRGSSHPKASGNFCKGCCHMLRQPVNGCLFFICKIAGSKITFISAFPAVSTTSLEKHVQWMQNFYGYFPAPIVHDRFSFVPYQEWIKKDFNVPPCSGNEEKPPFLPESAYKRLHAPGPVQTPAPSPSAQYPGHCPE